MLIISELQTGRKGSGVRTKPSISFNQLRVLGESCSSALTAEMLSPIKKTEEGSSDRVHLEVTR